MMKGLSPLQIDAAGWCDGGRHCASPNINQRPACDVVDLLVIHNISLPPGEFGGPEIEDLFCNRIDSNHPKLAELAGLEVSAHFLIRRDGEIIQFASGDARAWHAGRSEFAGRTNCNDFSLGIELEGSDFVAFADAQYSALARLTEALCARYPLAHVRGHQHIAPGRKTDPGPFFDWRRYQQQLQQLNGTAQRLSFPDSQ